MRTGRILAMSAALALAAGAAWAQPAGFEVPAGRYAGDPAHSSVTFRISHFGLSNYTARFARISSEVVLDPVRPENSRLVATIDARSVKTDFPFADRTNFDAEIGRDPRFLDGDNHPEIRFVSRRITRTGANTADIEGELTLRGVTRPVVLKAVLNGQFAEHPMMKKPVFGISAFTEIRRSDFGLTIYEGVLGERVTVQIEAEYAPAEG